MSPNKKMVYIWDENLDFFEELARNKQASSKINELLAKERRQGSVEDKNMIEVRKRLGYPEPTEG